MYHCQQAAEKAIKGYLTYHEVEFERTHNLVAAGRSEPEARSEERV